MTDKTMTVQEQREQSGLIEREVMRLEDIVFKLENKQYEAVQAQNIALADKIQTRLEALDAKINQLCAKMFALDDEWKAMLEATV